VIRLLGLDVGSVRIGVALSDPLGLTAQPLEVIDRRRVDAVRRVVELLAKYEVQRIVVGQPLTLAGEAGLAVEAVDGFVAALQKETDLPIERWDERMTTAAAQRVMIEGGARREKRKGRIDKIAAALILQSYLDARGTFGEQT